MAVAPSHAAFAEDARQVNVAEPPPRRRVEFAYRRVRLVCRPHRLLERIPRDRLEVARAFKRDAFPETRLCRKIRVLAEADEKRMHLPIAVGNGVVEVVPGVGYAAKVFREFAFPDFPELREGRVVASIGHKGAAAESENGGEREAS